MASKGRDPKGLYQTLGVSTGVDEGEIRKAYRRLALKWHPDKNPDNPEATAEFQKISSAYEVLSAPERREMYDSTGCIDADELNEGEDFDHAADLFASFFGGAGSADMDDDEQAMLDEFLRITGGGAFRRRGRGRGKKGRGGRGARTAGSSAARMEEQMMSEMFSAFGGMGGMGNMGNMGMSSAPPPPAPACPSGHTMKKRKADATYACDVCEARIAEGKRFLDCRKCDFSVCSKCAKSLEQESAEREQEEEYRELMEAFCQMNVTPVSHGRRLQFRCDFCKTLVASSEDAVKHMEEAHEPELAAMLEQEMDGGGLMDPFGGMGDFGGGFPEEIFMMDQLLGGGMPGGPSGSGGGRRKKKR